MSRPLLVTSILALIAGCVPAPKQSYTVEQLGKLESLEELMRVQAHEMDQLFAKRNQQSFSDPELGAMATAAKRVDATSTALFLRFSQKYEGRFKGFSAQLNAGAKELLAAAEAKQGPRAAAALTTMKQACAACHKVFK